MAHIELPEGIAGIRGPMMFRPETAEPLNALAEVLLRGENSLTRGERELIASRVSSLNECKYCCNAHSAFAAVQLEDGWNLVDSVLTDPASAPVSPKMVTLLAIADKVQEGGKSVTDDDVAAARAQGATDTEIHDTVLIAATFCMFNRYVDGLNTWAPDHREFYEDRAHMIAEHGYVNALPSQPVVG